MFAEGLNLGVDKIVIVIFGNLALSFRPIYIDLMGQETFQNLMKSATVIHTCLCMISGDFWGSPVA